jgi:hypothetical protein
MMLPALRRDPHDELAVFFRCHSGELSRNPTVVQTSSSPVIGPTRHAGHLDAVLHDPEQLGIGVPFGRKGQIQRPRIMNRVGKPRARSRASRGGAEPMMVPWANKEN